MPSSPQENRTSRAQEIQKTSLHRRSREPDPRSPSLRVLSGRCRPNEIALQADQRGSWPIISSTTTTTLLTFSIPVVSRQQIRRSISSAGGICCPTDHARNFAQHWVAATCNGSEAKPGRSNKPWGFPGTTRTATRRWRKSARRPCGEFSTTLDPAIPDQPLATGFRAHGPNA